MNLLAKVQFGSVLYGTNVPESDTDYRAIYLPTMEDCLLMRARTAWEDKTEEDTSYFSLQHFMGMAAEGQSIAIELLSAPDRMVASSSPTWEFLRHYRKRFFTKSMHSFLGFAKTMSGKYSMRVDRLNEAETVLRVLDNPVGIGDPEAKLGAIWDQLPTSINAEKTTNDRNAGPDKRVYRVCGRELQATVRIQHAYTVVKAIYDSYGERVRKAKDGQIEWKSLGHAFRAALQCKEIVETGDLRFPLKDAEWLREVRLGHVDFAANRLDEKLDNLIAEVQVKMDASSLPDKVEQQFVDRVILDTYRTRRN